MLSSWKDIAVLTQADAAGEPVVRAAATLALRHGASLTGLCALDPARGAPADAFARGSGVSDVLTLRHASDEAAGKAAGRRFAEILEPYDINKAFRIGWTDGIGEQAAITALHCDLIVATHSPLTHTPPAWSAEALLFSHGAPLLLTPGHPPERLGETVLVAWNGSREVRRAVNDAMPFLVRAHKVILVGVDDGGDVAPIPGPSAAEAVRHLACHGVRAETRTVSSDGRPVAACLQAEAADLACDMIVIGAYSHGRATEFVFGGVTRTLLGACGTAIFVSR